ncbi:MAG: hypothetical protein KBS74_06700 [Clostridiales bacterium]|nr:hypothetical protein [Candidatus Cacconaster stercorequi]
MAGKKLGYICYMMDKKTGEVQEIQQVAPEVKQKWAERLSSTMSDYYTQHMDEYTKLHI